jgi:diguanylate cyclase (GGDEF)-like protein/PAS domain S-box-containing protein
LTGGTAKSRPHQVIRSSASRSVLIIAALGTLMSCLVCGLMRMREAQLARDEFRNAAGTCDYAVRREIETNLAATHIVRGYINATAELNEAGFSRFAEEAIQANPSILTLEWVEHLPASGRQAFESGLKARGINPPYIRSNLLIPPRQAKARDVYEPVRFVYPRDNIDRIAGYDMAASPTVSAEIDLAARTGEPIVGSKIRLVEKTRDGLGLPVFLALRAQNAELRGFALIIFQLGEVLEKGLRDLKPEPIDIQFFDLSAPATKQFLYQHQWLRGGTKIAFRTEAEALAPADFKQVARLSAGGRNWAIVMTATEKYLAARRTWQPWFFGLCGLLLTAAVARHTLRNIGDARREEELIHLRELKDAEQALRQSEARYSLAAEGSKDGLWDWDLGSGKIYYSPRWKSMLGFADQEIGDTSDEWMRRIYPRDRERVERELAEHRAGQTDHFQSEYCVRHRDGTYRWFLTRGVAVRDSAGIATRMAGSQTDITDSKAADHLTGLASRLLLNEKLHLAIDLAGSDSRRNFAVLFIDLDRFKIINDSFGHTAGDMVLVQIADRLTSCAQRPAMSGCEITTARVGGDEFVLLVGRTGESCGATDLAKLILEALAPPLRLLDNQVFVSASIGIRMGEAGTTPESLLQDADTAMYHAKARGKDRFEVFTPAMRSLAVERLRSETDLRRAIESGGMVLHYQPKVCLVTGVVAELEALVRWPHPTRGLIPPAEFISLAEETGLILPLGKWVLETACRQMAGWHARFTDNPRMRISVNVSAKQFTQPLFLSEVMSVLSATGLAPEHLSIEITESVLMENTETTLELLHKLREAKIGLQIDDFGSGYSSLNYLHRFPVNALKIDRAFVRELGLRPENAQIVETIVMLARTLGMSVIAEGVETVEQLRHLSGLGCDYAQGHLFSPPLDSDRVVQVFDGFSTFLGQSVPATSASSPATTR